MDVKHIAPIWAEQPALVLKWRRRGDYEWHCEYFMSLPLQEHDIRRPARGYLKLQLGGTLLSKSSQERTPDFYGEIETPFRDGAHIRFDMERLRLPGFVTYNGKTEPIKPYEPRP